MPIQEWKEPIYQPQKGENKRANFYLNQWLDYTGSLRNFAKHIIDKWNQSGINLESEFHQYDIKHNCPPSLSIILKWSMCDKWEDRKTKYWQDRQAETNSIKFQIHAKNDIKVFELQEDIRLLNLLDLKEGLEKGILNGTQRVAIAQTNKHLQDASNRDMGEVKDINKTNVDANVEKNLTLNKLFDDKLLDELLEEQ